MGWKESLLNVAPMLATLLGGPLAGGATEGVVNLVKVFGKELGLKPKEITPEKVVKTLEKDPKALEIAAKFEAEHKLELEKILLARDVAYLQDKQNARARQVESEKALGKRDINIYIFAYAFISGFFVATCIMLILLLKGAFPETVPQFVIFLLGSLFGTLNAGVVSIIQYFYGSSKGSELKTQSMTKQLESVLNKSNFKETIL